MKPVHFRRRRFELGLSGNPRLAHGSLWVYLDRDLDITLADPDLADPALSHQVHEALDLIERQTLLPGLFFSRFVQLVHTVGNSTRKAVGKCVPGCTMH